MKTAEQVNFRRCFGYAVLSALVFTSSSLILSGQTAVNFKAQSRNIDFTGAPFTRPVKTGATLPASCSVGDLFFNTSAPSGQNLYGCPTANTWTVLAGGSGLGDPGQNGVLVRTGVNATAAVGSATAPLNAQNIESVFYADQFANVQAAITAAGSAGIVVIPASYSGTDIWSNPNSIHVLDYRSNSQTVYNVRNWGCKGDGVSDDTACLTAFFNFINGKNQAVAYFPAGKYLMNGTLRSTSSVWIRGDGYTASYLVETNPTADLLIVSGATQSAGGWGGGPTVSDLAFAGEGPATTGNLLVNATSGRALFERLGFYGHGGRALLIQCERGFYNDIHFSDVRQAIATNASNAINESYLRNFTIMNPGLANNDIGIGPAGQFCYNVNSNSGGVYPSSGAVQQDPHFAIDLNANITNFVIADGSIKPTTCIGGIRVRASNIMSIEHVYIEGYNDGSVNPSIVYGGAHDKSPLTSAITATQTTFDIANGEWFAPFVGSAADLENPQGITSYIIRPPDYVVGSTAASVLGNGITQGSYEYVAFQGIVHDATTSGWHVYVTARGGSSTTPIAWPAGAIFEDGWGSLGDNGTLRYPDDLRLADDHLESVAPNVGHTVTCDNGNEKTCGEIVVGLEPDAFFAPGSSNIRQFQMGIRFDGTDQVFCNASPGGIIDAYTSVLLDFRGSTRAGGFVDQGGSMVSTTNFTAGAVGACSITRNVFSNGTSTALSYVDPSSDMWTWSGPNSSWNGYSLSSFSSLTGQQPTMFLAPQSTFHVTGANSSATLPWDWAFNSGLQQTFNGTPRFAIDGSGNVSTPGSSTAARSIAHVNVAPFSATPQFDLSTGDQTLTLTGNVSSSTLVNLSAGQRVTFRICQDSTGGRTFAWPATVHGVTAVGPAAGTCTVQEFESFDGSTLNAIGPAVANQ